MQICQERLQSGKARFMRWTPGATLAHRETRRMPLYSIGIDSAFDHCSQLSQVPELVRGWPHCERDMRKNIYELSL